MSHKVGDDRPLLAALCRALIAAVEGRRDDAQREIATAQARLSPLSDAERETHTEKTHGPHPVSTPCPGGDDEQR